MISIKGKDKAAVLVALYNRAQVQGMGIFQGKLGDMSLERARKLVDDQAVVKMPGGNTFIYFDYVAGRILKVDLSADEFDEWLYDRDNGRGAAWEALKKAGLV